MQRPGNIVRQCFSRMENRNENAQLACGFVFAASVMTAAPVAAALSDRHDGVWAVSLFTEQGSCDSTSSSRINVRDGRVNENLLVASITGAVNPNGAVALRVTRGSDAMTAQGRIRGSRASGSWTSVSRNCSGSWTAVRA